MRTDPIIRRSGGDADPGTSRRARRWRLAVVAVLAGALVVGLVVTLADLTGSPKAPPATRFPVSVGPPAADKVPSGASAPRQPSDSLPSSSLAARRLVIGFYSAGFKASQCYGSCRAGDPGAEAAASSKARMAELARLRADFVINNSSPVQWYSSAPNSFLGFLDDLHRHGIGVSYGLASGRGDWFDAGGFTTAPAEAQFRATDLDHDGVSDLDGKIDALYQAHEVLEWANHAQRVRMYQTAKRWLPHTPVVVYYAGLIQRPIDPAYRTQAHGDGNWLDYAYGPGEADIVHLSARNPFEGARFEPARSRSGLLTDVGIVLRATPGMPIWVHSSFAGDQEMRTRPGSMWTPAQIEAWYQAVTSVQGVRGVFLRSFGRFTYDLGNPRFSAQREAWRRIGETSAP
jgi:hypothetical protein